MLKNKGLYLKPNFCISFCIVNKSFNINYLQEIRHKDTEIQNFSHKIALFKNQVHFHLYA